MVGWEMKYNYWPIFLTNQDSMHWRKKSQIKKNDRLNGNSLPGKDSFFRWLRYCYPFCFYFFLRLHYALADMEATWISFTTRNGSMGNMQCWTIIIMRGFFSGRLPFRREEGMCFLLKNRIMVSGYLCRVLQPQKVFLMDITGYSSLYFRTCSAMCCPATM